MKFLLSTLMHWQFIPPTLRRQRFVAFSSLVVIGVGSADAKAPETATVNTPVKVGIVINNKVVGYGMTPAGSTVTILGTDPATGKLHIKSKIGEAWVTASEVTRAAMVTEFAPKATPAAAANVTPKLTTSVAKFAISVGMATENKTAAPKQEGQKCFVDHIEETTFEPSIEGIEAPATLRLFAVVETKEVGRQTTEHTRLIQVSEQEITNGKKPENAKTFVHYWGCECCSRHDKYNPKVTGWVAEAEQGGQIVSTAKSSPEIERTEPVKKIFRLGMK